MLPVATPSFRPPSSESLTDAELENRLKRLVAIERRALSWLLAHLGEFDRRRLHAGKGHPSLFSYCTRVLGYSEQAAYKRIQAARAARAHPSLLPSLAAGEVTLTALVILAPHLRTDNLERLVAQARGRPTREIERLVAAIAPREDAADCLRLLPGQAVPEVTTSHSAGDTRESSGTPRPVIQHPPALPPRGEIAPLSERRHLFRFSASTPFRTKFERSRDVLGSASMERVFEAALDALLDVRDPERRLARRRARGLEPEERKARENGERGRTRRIPIAIRDAVWTRDGGRCTFTAPDGSRCPATRHLEIDHVLPYALGGTSDDAANLRLLCRTHNLLEAEKAFGEGAVPRRHYP